MASELNATPPVTWLEAPVPRWRRMCCLGFRLGAGATVAARSSYERPWWRNLWVFSAPARCEFDPPLL
jgi:hypothetical protein